MSDAVINLLKDLLKPLFIALAIILVVCALSKMGITFIRESNKITIATNYTSFTNVVIVVTNPNPGWLYGENQQNRVSSNLSIPAPIIPFSK